MFCPCFNWDNFGPIGGGNLAFADELPLDYCALKFPFEPIRAEIEQIAIDEIHGKVEYGSGPPGVNSDPKYYKYTTYHENTTYSVSPGYYQEENPDSSDDDRVKFNIEIYFKVENRMSPSKGYVFLISKYIDLHFSLRFLNNEPVDPDVYNCSVENGDPIDFQLEGFPNVVVEDLGISGIGSLTSGQKRRVRRKVREAGFTRCEIQQIFAESFDPIFGETPMGFPGIELPDSDDLPPLYFRDIWMSPGHMLVSDDYLFFRIPCVPVSESGPIGGSTCTNPVGIENLSCVGEAINKDRWVLLGSPGYFMDFPKVIDNVLKTNPEMSQMALQYNLQVTCNHGNDCSETGDEDGDGFCDDMDFCPGMVTGANCEHDGDGFGEGAFTEGCPILDKIDDWVKWKNLDSPWESEKHRMQVAQLLCGACDNCPGTKNPLQHDMDYDGLGDACDPDIDGDGVRNEYDCDPYNPFVGPDRDDDGVCDEYLDRDLGEFVIIGNYEFCIGFCETSELYYYDHPFFDLERCKEKCEVDNCITQYHKEEVYETLCSHIDHCISVGATMSEEDCSPNGPNYPPYCTFVENPNGPNDCVPYIEACAEAFANTYQYDINGNGIGDLCEEHPTVSELNFYPGFSGAASWGMGSYSMWFGDERFMLNFRTVGGEMDAVDNPGELPYLSKSTLSRNGVKAGACYCTEHKDDGSWEDGCTEFEIGKCRQDRDRNPISGKFIWSPINSPALAETITFTVPELPPIELELYPVSGNEEQGFPEHYDAAKYYDLFLYRAGFTFMRERSENNFHEFDWVWPESVDYDPQTDEWFNNAEEYEADKHPDNRTVSIRMAWGDYDRDENPLTEVAITENERIGQSQKDTGPGPLLIPKDQLIVTVIPAAVNHWDDPRGPLLPDYFMGIDPLTGVSHLYGMSAGTPEVTRIWAAEFSVPVSIDARITGTAGRMEAGMLGMGQGNTVVMFYQEPNLGDGTGEETLQPEMYMGVLDDVDDGVIFMSAGDLFGTTTPYIQDAQMVYLPGIKHALVFGTHFTEDPGGAPITHPGDGIVIQPEVWSFSLLDGTWNGPYTLNGLEGLSGHTVVYERSSNKVMVFGGEDATGQSSAKVFAMDPMTLAVRELAAIEPPPMGVERSGAGVYLDRRNRDLIVYGGKRSGEWLGDGWSFDLTSRRWTLLTGATAAPQPVEELRPYVYYDTGRGTLWSGAVLGAKPSDGLPLQGYDGRTGEWKTTPAVRLPGHITWPVEDTYTAGRTHSYTYQTPEEAAWPGQAMIAALSGPETLDLRIFSRTGEIIGKGENIGEERWAAFVCRPGEGCSARVRTLRGEAPPYGEEFTLDMKPAEPTLENMVSPGGKLNDMILKGNEIYIAGMQGLRITAADSSLGMLSETRGFGNTAMTGISVSGSKVFISRLGLHGLVILDAKNPSSPVELGRTFTLGASWDVAVYGDRAYMAHGIFGVGVYDVSDPENPAWINQMWPGGRIKSVSMHRGLLAAGRSNGKVYIYDMRNGGQEQVGEVDAGWKIGKVEFREGKLWVLRKNGKRVAVFEQNPEGEWEKACEITDDGAVRYFFGRTSGARGYTIGKNTVEAYMFEPVH